MFDGIATFLYYSLPLILFLGSILLFFVKITDIQALENYRKARKALGVAYFVFGVAWVVSIVITVDVPLDLLSMPLIWLIVSSIQAFLFSYALVVLIDINYFTRKRIYLQVTPITFLVLVTIVALILNIQAIKRVMFICFLSFYLYQLIYYTRLFFRRYHGYLNDAENFFSDNEAERLRWVQSYFICALLIGTLALVPIFYENGVIALLMMLFFGLFYTFLLIKYMNYPHIFYTLKEFFLEESSQPTALTPPNNLEERINAWVEEKRFCEPGITISVLQNELSTNRTYLSYYINTQQKANFSVWINSLRVEEAKPLLTKRLDLTVADIAYMTGFGDLSTFSRQFKKNTGFAPREWRKQAN